MKRTPEIVAGVMAGMMAAGEVQAATPEVSPAAPEIQEVSFEQAHEAIIQNRDSVNLDYKPVPSEDGRTITLQSTRNDSGANVAEMELTLSADGRWHMVPKSDSFDWLKAQTGQTFDGLVVDPTNRAEFNAAINLVVGADAALDRYMQSASSVKASSEPADFGSLLDAGLSDVSKDAAVKDALAYLKMSPLSTRE